MSLCHLQAIPVDTHVFKIAAQHYIQNLSGIKSVTPKIYTQIGDCFREVYGPLAGWAQTVKNVMSNLNLVGKSKVFFYNRYSFVLIWPNSKKVPREDPRHVRNQPQKKRKHDILVRFLLFFVLVNPKFDSFFGFYKIVINIYISFLANISLIYIK